MSQREAPLVLVVDDDAAARIVARECLETAGFEVSEAADGPEALLRLDLVSPDLVLLDVRMPGMDGFEVCARVRSSAAQPHTPVLMMTACGDVESIQTAYRVGATDFLMKPVSPLLLGHRVEYMLRAARSAAELRASQQALEKAQRIAGLGYWQWEIESDRLQPCPFVEKTFSIVGDGHHGFESLLRSVHPEDRLLVRNSLRALMAGRDEGDIEFRIGSANATIRYVRQQAEAEHDADGRAIRITGTVQDITERRRAQARVEFLAKYDALTGLPNRASLQQRLERALSTCSSASGRTAVLFLGLHRFKQINETLGHGAGDVVLQQVAERLRECAVRAGEGAPCEQRRPSELFHFAGTQFVLVLSGITDPHEPESLVQCIATSLSRPFEARGRSVRVAAKVGIALSRADGETAEALLQNAESALNHAKVREGSFQYYSEEMNAEASVRLMLESDLSQAIDKGQLCLYYQPQFNIAQQMVGVEALVRWQHPTLGMLAPGSFIPLAEETGLILEISDWVLDHACRQAREWQERNLALRMAVNISSRRFAQPDFCEAVKAALEETGLDPARLDLELTETTLMRDRASTNQVLEALRSLGIRFSIDDFGTGYSSLDYIRRFSPTALKLDRAFVKDLPEDRDSVAITRAVLALARSLGLKVIAEGVERENQLLFLAGAGCDEVQGFLLARPMPIEALDELLLEVTRPVVASPESVSFFDARPERYLS